MAAQKLEPVESVRQIAVTSSLEAEETISALLETLFETTPSTAIKEGANEAVTSVFIPNNPDTAANLKSRIRKKLDDLDRHGVGVGNVSLRVRKIRPQDWRESWKRHFRTIEINPRLLVKPPWSRKKAKAQQETVILDPGMSFGTGNHPTTLFCLKQIAAFDATQTTPSLLDIGTGSGILAIAAAKLGFAPVDAFDNDADAVTSSIENATRNDILPSINLFQGSLEELPMRAPKMYTFVCANLTHDLLKSHAKRIVSHVADEGLLCLAGILNEQFDTVCACFEQQGFRLSASEALNEWKSGAFRRTKRA